MRRRLPKKGGSVATASILAFAILSCTADPIGAPRDIAAGTARAAKSAPPTSSGISVTSASPAYGDQGTSVNVHVFGAGFTAGAQATWLLHGVADPSHVHTNSTTFVSSTELVANITIASDATLDFWDVQVALAGGKNGVGSEAFEVTAAQILGPGTTGGGSTLVGANDLLEAVGFSSPAGSTTNAWVYDPATSMVSLGAGKAQGIDPLGAFVVGEDSRPIATVWVKQAGNTWLPQSLPQLAGSVGSSAYGATRLTDGTAIAVGWNVSSNAKKTTNSATQAVAWRLGADGVWSAPQVYVTPPGYTSSDTRDVNRLGQVIGHLDVTHAGIVWDSPTVYTILDGKAARINQAGTLIVGQTTSNIPMYWWRDPVTHQWHLPGVVLPSLAGSSCPTGFGLDVNDAGIIVGWSCAGATTNPTVWQLDLSGSSPVLVGSPTRLPGLGFVSSDDGNAARAVTNTPPYVVFGSAYINKSQRTAVQWLLR